MPPEKFEMWGNRPGCPPEGTSGGPEEPAEQVRQQLQRPSPNSPGATFHLWGLAGFQKSNCPQVSSAGTDDPLQVQQSPGFGCPLEPGSETLLQALARRTRSIQERLIYGIKKEQGENGMKEDKPKISICAHLLLDKLSSFPICQR